VSPLAWLGVLLVGAAWALLTLRAARTKNVDARDGASACAGAAAGAVMLASDPFFAMLSAGQPVDPGLHRDGLLLGVAASVGVAATAGGVALIRAGAHRARTDDAGAGAQDVRAGADTSAGGGGGGGGGAWSWIAAAVLMAMLVKADRVQPIDGQLMFLGAVTLLWMRHARAKSHGPLVGLAAAGVLIGWGASGLWAQGAPGSAWSLMGVVLLLCAQLMVLVMGRAEGGRAALLIVMMGMGVPALAQSAVQALSIVPAVQRSNVGTLIELVSQLVAGQPMRWGLSNLTPEVGAALLGLLGAIAWRSDARQPGVRSVRRLLGAAVIGFAAGLVAVRAWQVV
jgi:hypothetical protein